MASFLADLNEIKRYLIDKGELVFAQGNGFSIDAKPRGQISMLIIFEPRPGEISFILPLPGSILAIHLPETLKILNRINGQLTTGIFYLREDRDEWAVIFAMYAYYNHDGTISDVVIDRIINACRVTAEYFMPEIFDQL